MTMIKREGKLLGLEAKVENGVRIALILWANLTAKAAKKRVHVITRRLKDSISYTKPYNVGAKILAIDTFAATPYAKEEEFREGEKHGTQHAYMRPAFNETKKSARTILAKSVIKALKRK